VRDRGLRVEIGPYLGDVDAEARPEPLGVVAHIHATLSEEIHADALALTCM